ncbi:MAG: hypothetical protein KF861_11455 [Planctomycetaceae bacterium]|nr:hypothetical protein [Planctomycetaceae bacterium]
MIADRRQLFDAERSQREYGNQPRVLAIAYSFPPISGSGAIRNLKILKHLPEYGWRMRVLSVSSPGSLTDGERRLMEQIPEETDVVRAWEFQSDRLLGRLRQTLSPGKRGASGVAGAAAVAGADSPNANGQTPQKASAARSRWQRFKDTITNVLSIPDRHVGWFPCATWAGCRALQREPVDVIYAVGKPWTSFFVGYVLKVLFRKPLVIDFMDPWRDSPWAR